MRGVALNVPSGPRGAEQSGDWGLTCSQLVQGGHTGLVTSHPLKVWEEKLHIKDGKYALSFRLIESHPFMACVPLPY